MSETKQPIVAMDSDGQASVVNYQLPEPTSYRINSVISLDFDPSYFNEPYGSATQEAVTFEAADVKEWVRAYNAGTLTYRQLQKRTAGRISIAGAAKSTTAAQKVIKRGI